MIVRNLRVASCFGFRLFSCKLIIFQKSRLAAIALIGLFHNPIPNGISGLAAYDRIKRLPSRDIPVHEGSGT